MGWWVPRPSDLETRSIVNCTFIADVQKILADGSIGATLPLKPTKTAKILKDDPTVRWMTDDIPLGDLRIVGPFDFQKRRMGLKGAKHLAISETNHIDEVYWRELETKAPRAGIAVDNIRITPA